MALSLVLVPIIVSSSLGSSSFASSGAAFAKQKQKQEQEGAENKPILIAIGFGSLLHRGDKDKESAKANAADKAKNTEPPKNPQKQPSSPAPVVRAQEPASSTPSANGSGRIMIDAQPANEQTKTAAPRLDPEPTAQLQPAIPTQTPAPVEPFQPQSESTNANQFQPQQSSNQSEAPSFAPQAMPANQARPGPVNPEIQGNQSNQFAQPAEIISSEQSGLSPDNALVSVLNDLSRTLKEPAELDKIEDANQKAVLLIARQILAKALAQPGLAPDRIVRDRDKSMSKMNTEAWASGEVKLTEKTRGSLAAVWAKHENGLVNVTIAGDCSDRMAPNGRRIGEFVVIINAKSPVEKGFDIQTQSEVDFWIGKLSNIAIEASCFEGDGSSDKSVGQTAGATNLETVNKKQVVLQPVITQRGRQYMEQTTASSGVSVEAAELTGSSRSSKSSPATKGSGGTSLAKAPPPVAVTMPKTVVAQEDIRTPAISAALVLPDRVIAGQNMTASAITTVGAGEPSVELSFNNSSIFTDKHGLAFYEVPEDATPGRSLNISFTARTESQPVAIEVIQPLSTSSGQQAPKMERIALTGGNRVAIIDGHNFDGYGQQNRVTIDGRTEAKVLASSPVQVKVLLPSTILPGVHSVAITVGGTRSAAIAFKIAGSQNAHRTAARQ